jgi:hypothetical protein
MSMSACSAGAALAAGAAKLNFNDNGDVQDVNAGLALAGITFTSAGGIIYIGNGAPANPTDEWWDGSSVDGSLYEVAYTALASGDGPTALASPLGVYIALTANRTWSRTSVLSLADGQWTFRVRRIAIPAQFREATIRFVADGR